MFAHDAVQDHIHLVEQTTDHSSAWDHLPAVPTGDAQSFVLFVIVAGTALLVANSGIGVVSIILEPKIRSAIGLGLFGLVALAVYGSNAV